MWKCKICTDGVNRVSQRGLFTRSPLARNRATLSHKGSIERPPQKDLANQWLYMWAAGNPTLRRLVDGYNYDQAMHYWKIMRDTNFSLTKLNERSFEIAFELFEKVGSPWDVIDNYEYMKKLMEPSDYTRTFVIKAYCSVGMMDKALDLYKQLQEKPNSMALVPIIDGFLKRNTKEDLDLIEKNNLLIGLNFSNASDIRLNTIDIEYLNLLLTYNYKTGNLNRVPKLYNLIHETERGPTPNTYLRMLRIFIAEGDVDNFLEVASHFDKFIKKKARRFNYMQQKYIEKSYQDMHDKNNVFEQRKVDIEDLNTFRYLLLEMYSVSADPRVHEYLSNKYDHNNEPFVIDSLTKFYRDFLLRYKEEGGPLDKVIEGFLENGIKEGLSRKDIFPDGRLTTNRFILQELWLESFPGKYDMEEKPEQNEVSKQSVPVKKPVDRVVHNEEDDDNEEGRVYVTDSQNDEQYSDDRDYRDDRDYTESTIQHKEHSIKEEINEKKSKKKKKKKSRSRKKIKQKNVEIYQEVNPEPGTEQVEDNEEEVETGLNQEGDNKTAEEVFDSSEETISPETLKQKALEEDERWLEAYERVQDQIKQQEETKMEDLFNQTQLEKLERTNPKAFKRFIGIQDFLNGQSSSLPTDLYDIFERTPHDVDEEAIFNHAKSLLNDSKEDYRGLPISAALEMEQRSRLANYRFSRGWPEE